ncbi:MAG: hypothetical protein ACU0AZ_01215 [Paracoccaceae bacterium]
MCEYLPVLTVLPPVLRSQMLPHFFSGAYRLGSCYRWHYHWASFSASCVKFDETKGFLSNNVEDTKSVAIFFLMVGDDVGVTARQHHFVQAGCLRAPTDTSSTVGANSDDD